MHLEDMSAFEHRGQTYYADDNEHIYNGAGKFLGYISGRGRQYQWSAVTLDQYGEENEFARGHGVWEQDWKADDPDPALDAILEAHGEREPQETWPATRQFLDTITKLGNDPALETELTNILAIVDDPMARP